jgi:hypothetical protein
MIAAPIFSSSGEPSPVSHLFLRGRSREFCLSWSSLQQLRRGKQVVVMAWEAIGSSSPIRYSSSFNLGFRAPRRRFSTLGTTRRFFIEWSPSREYGTMWSIW